MTDTLDGFIAAQSGTSWEQLAEWLWRDDRVNAELHNALEALVRGIPDCTCGAGFKSRGLVAPGCVRCWLADEIAEAEAALRAARGE